MLEVEALFLRDLAIDYLPEKSKKEIEAFIKRRLKRNKSAKSKMAKRAQVYARYLRIKGYKRLWEYLNRKRPINIPLNNGYLFVRREQAVTALEVAACDVVGGAAYYVELVRDKGYTIESNKVGLTVLFQAMVFAENAKVDLPDWVEPRYQMMLAKDGGQALFLREDIEALDAKMNDEPDPKAMQEENQRLQKELQALKAEVERLQSENDRLKIDEEINPRKEDTYLHMIAAMALKLGHDFSASQNGTNAKIRKKLFEIYSKEVLSESVVRNSLNKAKEVLPKALIRPKNK